MCTSLVLFALSGMFTPAVTEGPAWHDYRDGLERSERENKPIAVFVGTGKKGWEKLSQEGQFNRQIHRQLSNDYVCVYVDAKREEQLASAFRIDGAGLVISNAGGSLQAFRHEGNLANEDLEHYLRQFSDPNRVTRQTEDTRRTSYYQAPVQPPVAPAAFTGGACRT